MFFIYMFTVFVFVSMFALILSFSCTPSSSSPEFPTKTTITSPS